MNRIKTRKSVANFNGDIRYIDLCKSISGIRLTKPSIIIEVWKNYLKLMDLTLIAGTNPGDFDNKQDIGDKRKEVADI